eukprot:scaffold230969_cov35-Tisochrysis_lutea.AAC.1
MTHAHVAAGSTSKQSRSDDKDAQSTGRAIASNATRRREAQMTNEKCGSPVVASLRSRRRTMRVKRRRRRHRVEKGAAREHQQGGPCKRRTDLHNMANNRRRNLTRGCDDEKDPLRYEAYAAMLAWALS